MTKPGYPAPGGKGRISFYVINPDLHLVIHRRGVAGIDSDLEQVHAAHAGPHVSGNRQGSRFARRQGRGTHDRFGASASFQQFDVKLLEI